MPFEWVEYFEALQRRQSTPLAFAIEWWHYNAPLLEQIKRIVPPPARILEVGTGTGALSVMLAAHGYDVMGIDIDPEVVGWARTFADPFRVPCRFEVADGFNLAEYEGKFDLAFSAGVLEHFPVGNAVRMLREKARAARYVLAVVPTRFALRNDPFTQASGARPMRLRELQRLFEQAGLEVLVKFGYGAPDGTVARGYRYLTPLLVQRFLQNRLSYACTVGCVGKARNRGASNGVAR